jgi:hypothetical protein
MFCLHQTHIDLFSGTRMDPMIGRLNLIMDGIWLIVLHVDPLQLSS